MTSPGRRRSADDVDGAGGGVQIAIQEVLAGRLDAYAGIVRRYQEDVWRIVAYALREVPATEDLVQQVFVNAYLNLGTYDAGRDFGAWLRSMARNLVRNEIRGRLRERKALRSYHEHLAGRLADEDASERREARLRAALGECRRKLPLDTARALEMRYGRSLAFGDIASALGRTVAATRQMLQRVRVRLRRCLEERMART